MGYDFINQKQLAEFLIYEIISQLIPDGYYVEEVTQKIQWLFDKMKRNKPSGKARKDLFSELLFAKKDETSELRNEVEDLKRKLNNLEENYNHKVLENSNLSESIEIFKTENETFKQYVVDLQAKNEYLTNCNTSLKNRLRESP